MFKFSHRFLIICSGLIWLVVGCGLLQLGFNFLLQSVKDSASGGVLHYLSLVFGGRDSAAVVAIVAALLLGQLKGRFIMRKAAAKVVSRIKGLPDPTSISSAYSLRYYLLIGCMMGIGIVLQRLGIPLDIRGIIDVTIGGALINGSLAYFQLACGCKKESDCKEGG